MSGNKPLRDELECITKIRLPQIFTLELGKLSKKFGLTLKMIEVPSGRLNFFNCFAFALGIHQLAQFDTLVLRHADREKAITDSDFVSELISGGILKEVSIPQIGNIVIYFEGSKPKHAGQIVTSDLLIESKWGPGELFQHELWTVPASYGDSVRFFIIPEPERIFELLQKYLG